MGVKKFATAVSSSLLVDMPCHKRSACSLVVLLCTALLSGGGEIGSSAPRLLEESAGTIVAGRDTEMTLASYSSKGQKETTVEALWVELRRKQLPLRDPATDPWRRDWLDATSRARGALTLRIAAA